MLASLDAVRYQKPAPTSSPFASPLFTPISLTPLSVRRPMKCLRLFPTHLSGGSDHVAIGYCGKYKYQISEIADGGGACDCLGCGKLERQTREQSMSVKR